MSDQEVQMPPARKIIVGVIIVGVILAALMFWKASGSAPPAHQLTVSFFIIGVVVLVVTFGIVLVALLSPKGRISFGGTNGASKAALDDWQKKTLLVLVVLGALGVGSTFAWVGWGLKLDAAGPELTLPLIVIIGAVVLLLTLALVAVTFSILDMQDKTQALALPEGSVRAVIALMLLLVFAIAAIFLYSNVSSSGKLRSVENLTAAQVNGMKKQVAILFTVPELSEKKDEKYTAYYKDPTSDAANDIAKQLIVLLGTLVTAVASFYFGSSSVASARDAADRAFRGVAGPNATGVNPPALNADGTLQSLTITGVNLQNVTAVELVSGDKKTRINADPGSVKASATNVSCNVTVPKGTPPGSYDVTVTDNTNNSSIIRISIAGPAAQPAASTLKPDGIDRKDLGIGVASQSRTITGAGLAKVNKIEFKRADGKTISVAAATIKPEDAKVAFDVSVPQDATLAGSYDVVVSDGVNTATVQNVKVTVA
jgi:hypothetical protein